MTKEEALERARTICADTETGPGYWGRLSANIASGLFEAQADGIEQTMNKPFWVAGKEVTRLRAQAAELRKEQP